MSGKLESMVDSNNLFIQIGIGIGELMKADANDDCFLCERQER